MKIEYLKDGNVVALASARRERKFPAIAQIEAYWHGLRNGRLMPTRSDVDPRGIGDNLAFAFVLERIAPGHARIRLAGQHLSDIMSMEVRGMPISAFFLPQARDEVQDALERAFDMPAEVHMSLQSEASMFQPALDAQMILLPLKNNEGRVTRLLGAIQVKGKLARGPHRFSIRNIDATALTVDAPASDMAHEAEKLRRSELDRPGYWDIRGGKTAEADVTRVDIRPAHSAENRSSEGHIMRPSGPSGVQVPGLAELAESFHGKTVGPNNAPLKTRPGGHLRLVSTD
ncbi:PAS domain-containing protein [Aliiroseovarius sp. 2305UL8-7]|uniref:PAS domain-containing protein n=1 Tax=Aliiroseovarius conchicola TaxID=3121637 RepID=UPI0035299CEE